MIERLRSRRRGRGAIFVESIVVISMMMIMMGGGLFFHRLYAMKLRTIRQSRVAAWTKALPGCNSAIGLAAVWQAVGLANAASNGAFDGLNEDSQGMPNWMQVGREADVKTETVSSSNVVGGQSFQMKTTNSVVCNEKANDDRGDIISVLKYAWDATIP
jgi:hypothetical protein